MLAPLLRGKIDNMETSGGKNVVGGNTAKGSNIWDRVPTR